LADEFLDYLARGAGVWSEFGGAVFAPVIWVLVLVLVGFGFGWFCFSLASAMR
jgi:hypothetical protein